MLKTGFGPLLEVQMSFRVAGARDCAPRQKWAKREGFVAFPKTMAGVEHLKRICKDAFSVAGAIQETSSSQLLGGQGADFLRGVAFWSIRSCGLLRWFCVTGAALRMTWHHFFAWKAQYFRQVDWKNQIAKRIGTRPSALHSTFHFWRKSRRIALFLMLSSSKIEDVSQNCFVLDVVKFKNWGSLAELLRFGCCQLWKMKKSCRIASFLTLSSSNIEEVSQNSFVFKLADRQVDRQTDRQTDRQPDRQTDRQTELRERDTETQRHRDTEREREREIDR